MTSHSVLVPDFNHPFALDCDASGEGIGVVLSQQEHPITNEIQKLDEREKLLHIYGKEMFCVMHALIKSQ